MVTKNTKKSSKSSNAGNDESILEAIRNADEEYQKAVADLHALCQKKDSEARLELSKSTQEIQFEHSKAENAAYWKQAESHKEIPEGKEADAYQLSLKYEQEAAERRIKTEELLAGKAKEFEETLNKLRDTSLDQSQKIREQQVSRIQDIWSKVSPSDITNNELHVLSHLAITLAQSSPEIS